MNKIPISTHNTKLFISVNCLEVVSAPSLHSLAWRYDPVEFETELNLLHTRLRHIFRLLHKRWWEPKRNFSKGKIVEFAAASKALLLIGRETGNHQRLFAHRSPSCQRNLDSKWERVITAFLINSSGASAAVAAVQDRHLSNLHTADDCN